MVDAMGRTFLHHIVTLENYQSLINLINTIFPGIVGDCERIWDDFLLEDAHPSNFRTLYRCGASLKKERLFNVTEYVVHNIIRNSRNLDPKYLDEINFLIQASEMDVERINSTRYQLLIQQPHILSYLLDYSPETILLNLQDARFHNCIEIPNQLCIKILMNYGVVSKKYVRDVAYEMLLFYYPKYVVQFIKLFLVSGSEIKSEIIVYAIAQLFDQILAGENQHHLLINAVELLFFNIYGENVPEKFCITTKVMEYTVPQTDFTICFKDNMILLSNNTANSNITMKVFDNHINPICRELSNSAFNIVKHRILKICIAMKNLHLPVLIMVEIIEQLLPACQFIKYYLLWNLAKAVRHAK